VAIQLRAAEVTVFAAASLTDCLQHIAGEYEKQSADKIVFNFAASGVLARQIEAGAPADLFFSADERQMDGLAAKGLLDLKSRRDCLGNSLVIVTPPEINTIHSPRDLTNSSVHHLAIGDPKTVPAGGYAQAYLKKAGLWPAIQSRLVPSENVRSVLAVVESGNAEAGIVYRTDAAISKSVKVACEIPASDTPRIVYPIALLKESPQAAAAEKFLGFLDSDTAATAFRKAGFTVLKSNDVH
jgi:molybdate transport system substrate-binding protein